MDELAFWGRFNLRSSPFFTEPLRVNDFSLDLMVGREEEVRSALTSLGGSDSSRRSVMGAAGVGKTTLAERVKSEAAAAGFAVAPQAVRIDGPGGTGGLLVRMLAHGIAALQPRARAGDALTGALRRAAALVADAGHVDDSPDPMDQVVGAGTGLFREIARAALDTAGVPGLLVHLVVEEAHWASAEAESATRAVLDVRDLLLTSGCHFLVEGETRAVGRIVGQHVQVRETFSMPLILLPLSLDEVQELVRRRYEHLRLSTRSPVMAPVEDAAVERAYVLARGNLRRAMGLLEAAARRRFRASGPECGPVTAEDVNRARRRRGAS